MQNIDFSELDNLTNHQKDYGSYFENGYVVYDRDVGKEAFKHLSIIDRIFRPSKVATAILLAHALMCEQVQDLPNKES